MAYMMASNRRFVPLIDFIDAGVYVKGGGYTASTDILDQYLDKWIAEGKVEIVEMPAATFYGEGVVK